MTRSVFTDNFSEILNDEELKSLQESHKSYDPYYVASGSIKRRKERFDKLWQIFEPLADSHFLSEIKRHFHQRTWEMYLGAILLDRKLKIASLGKGPDFIINQNQVNEVFIEAVAAGVGDTSDRVPEMAYEIVQDVPEEEMLIRLANSIEYKYQKYREFIMEKQKPYVIAVNKGGLQYPDPQIPLVMKCLFSLGFEHYKKVNGKLTYAGWTRREFIEKKNGSKVLMNFFEKEESSVVSAVIYSKNTVLNHPKSIGTDCIVVHNPMASIPIDEDVFKDFIQYKKTSKGIQRI